MSRLWAGFDVGGQAVKAVLVDSKGTVHADGKRPTGLDCDVDRLAFLAVRLIEAERSRATTDSSGVCTRR